MHTELLSKLKELKNLSREVYIELEENGLKITDPNAGIAKEQFFMGNIKNITDAIEALLRGEASERPMVRLAKDLPDALVNLKKIKQTNAARMSADRLGRMEALLAYLENNYRDL